MTIWLLHKIASVPRRRLYPPPELPRGHGHHVFVQDGEVLLDLLLYICAKAQSRHKSWYNLHLSFLRSLLKILFWHNTVIICDFLTKSMYEERRILLKPVIILLLTILRFKKCLYFNASKHKLGKFM